MSEMKYQQLEGYIIPDFGHQKVYPDGSTGGYTCRCYSCGVPFMGHKRDNWCGKCETGVMIQQELEL